MIKPKYVVTPQLKEKSFVQFAKLIQNQIIAGSKKYAIDGDKEASDIICDAFGMEYALMNILKYALRYKTEQREKDLLKISTYCYIIWLNMGYHENKEHDEDIKKEESK
jgi:hypothetical protein